MYVGGSKILAVAYRNEIVWGHIDEKLSIRAQLNTRNANCIVEIEGKKYVLKSGNRLKITVSSAELTFVVKSSSAFRYNVVLNSKVVFEKETSSPEGKKYTLNLDKTMRNNIYIDFKRK